MNKFGGTTTTDHERLVLEQINVLAEHTKSGSPIDMGFVFRHAEMVVQLAANAWIQTDLSDSH